MKIFEKQLAGLGILLLGLAMLTFIGCPTGSNGPSTTQYWTVTFDTDGGTPETIADIQVVKGQGMGSQYPANPEKNDFNFIGWYLASDTDFTGTKYDADTAITADRDLKAKWLSTYTIEIKFNIIGDETGDSVTAYPTEGEAGDEITISYVLADTKLNNQLIFSGVTQSFDTVNSAGNGSITYTIVEADATDGTITINATFAHSDKTLVTITGLTAKDKEYDGTTDAKIEGTAVIEGIVGTDVVTVTAGTADFADKNVGTGKTITFKGYALGGADADNYYLSAQPIGVTANITALQLTIADPTVTTSKAYDGTTTAAVTAGALTNKIEGDTVNVSAAGTYDSADVGTVITITVVYTLSGADAGNYAKPDDYTTTGEITKAPVDPDRQIVIDFEDDALGTAKYTSTTNNNNGGTLTIVADPSNSDQKSLQIASNNWNQGAVIPVYLPYALLNYETVSFRARLQSGTINNPLFVYAASTTATFSNNNFGNTSGGFFANAIVNIPSSTVGLSSEWKDFEISLQDPLNATTKDLQGNIFIAIGSNNQTLTLQFDDIIFTLKDDFDAPPYITPVTGTYDTSSVATVNNVDIPVTMILQGKTLTSITNGSTTLSSGTDYTLSGKIVTLKKEYLAAQADGTTTLTFNFSSGATSTIAIAIKDSSKTLLKYDFGAGDTIEAGYPTYVDAGAAGTFVVEILASGVSVSTNAFYQKMALRVTKTSSSSKPKFILPFNLGGTTLNNYASINLVVRGISGGGELQYKNMLAQIGTTTTQIGTTSSSGFSFPAGDITNNTVKTVTIPITGQLTATGPIDIGFILDNNTGASSYEILSITLIPK